MKLEHASEVAAPLERVWEEMIDVERVAPCLPGAEVTEAHEEMYEGTFTLKLGPTTAAYAGASTPGRRAAALRARWPAAESRPEGRCWAPRGPNRPYGASTTFVASRRSNTS